MTNQEIKILAANVSRLSSLLTKDRENLPPGYLKDPGLREAYVRYFLPANMKKVHLGLRELSLHPSSLLEKSRLTVLDVGSGPGTALLGALSFFGERTERPSLACVAMDRVAENLRTAEELFHAAKNEKGIDASLKTVRAEVEAGVQLKGEGPFDLILFSNVLNELYPFDEDRVSKRADLVGAILDRILDEKGSCIIIEPALRTTSREMLEVGDLLLRKGLHIYSPCPAKGNCPALANPRDWCHEDIPWEPPALIKEIDTLAGLRKDSLKFSYLVVRKDNYSLYDAFGADSFRVVSEVLRSKGKLEFFVCGTQGRKLITRLDKDRTEANAFFDMLRRGTVAWFEGLADQGTRFKIEPETRVIVHRNAIQAIEKERA